MKKKVFCALLVALLAVCLMVALAACGGDGDGDGNQKPPPPTYTFEKGTSFSMADYKAQVFDSSGAFTAWCFSSEYAFSFLEEYEDEEYFVEQLYGQCEVDVCNDIYFRSYCMAPGFSNDYYILEGVSSEVCYYIKDGKYYFSDFYYHGPPEAPIAILDNLEDPGEMYKEDFYEYSLEDVWGYSGVSFALMFEALLDNSLYTYDEINKIYNFIGDYGELDALRFLENGGDENVDFPYSLTLEYKDGDIELSIKRLDSAEICNGINALTVSLFDVGTADVKLPSWVTDPVTVKLDADGGAMIDYFYIDYGEDYPARGGTAEKGEVVISKDRVFSLTVPTKTGCTFLGWHQGDVQATDEKGKCLDSWSYSGTVSLTAKWKELFSYERINEDGTRNKEGDYILFGEWPQTIKAASVTIGSTADSRGYFLGSDGFYYAKVTATPRASGYTFSNGASVTEDEEYFFKVEPIKWRILSIESGEAFILCESIIANKAFYKDENDRTINGETVYANNYEHSDIRAWLNDQFYNTAFNALQQALINTTVVDNSVASTGYSTNQYACANTNDKVFLLSYKEATSSAYGLSTDASRVRKTSDYSRATGAYTSSALSYRGNGQWWLRSPYISNPNSARFVIIDGNFTYYNYVYRTNVGVVPALKIRL